MEQFERELSETKSLRSEKASVMEDKYKESPDPWSNGKRKLYEPLMHNLVTFLLPDLIGRPHNWIDLGCGGGNVGKSIKKSLVDMEIPTTMHGCDISPTAIEYLKNDPDSPYDSVKCLDIEKLTLTEAIDDFAAMDVISLIEVMYYLGEKKPWKQTIDILWESITPGTLVIVADGLVSYQYREYLKSKSDAQVVLSYTDRDTPICRETSSTGRSWNRYLKVRVYQKVSL